ncbi:hypothetical protein LSCM1_07200 [Leishmania martiniquensis]|uniref:Uncharacterized protein n=1 Tax=Leishmania martiniquensis TaxID=1580590 RepID=A0A836I0E9_9TRYP|nr:hypothetical protein LSCM1_07200 [Leishmania martiniquensis]
MRGALTSGTGRLPRHLIAVLFAATALQGALSGTPLVAQAADDTPEPTAYVRRTYEVKVPFFTEYWWVGFIMLFVGFLLIVLVLYVTVQCHFKESDQRRRRKEVEATEIPMEGSSDDEMASHGGSHSSRSGQSTTSNPLCFRR